MVVDNLAIAAYAVLETCSRLYLFPFAFASKLAAVVTFPGMAAKKKEAEPVSHLNALIPTDLHRRLMIAKANSGKTMQQLVIDALTLVLEREERQADRKGSR